MIPFDLKSFKKGAIAVDKDWGEARFVGLKGDRLHCAFISGLEGVNVFDWVMLHYAESEWRMKEDQPSKWIVFREFDSEELAKATVGALEVNMRYPKGLWKLEKR